MTWKTLFWALAVWAFWGIPFSLSAQTVRFQVKDAETGKSVSGAVVRAVEKGGRTVRYGLTDQGGLAEMTPPQETDTLTISLLGYRKQSFLRPFQSQYQVALETEALQIRASGVTAHKVEEVGDTIRYSVPALKNKEDAVLSDVLKRLPGVEVSKAGYVKYNGQSINRFYVEGKDILESNYNLATQHLSVDAVQSVEILQNHQPIQMLRGIKESERAAMNIVLDEKARKKWTGTASAGAGIATSSPTFPMAGDLSAFYVAPEFSSVDVAGYDGQGNALQEPDYTLQQDRSYRHVSLRERIGLGGVPAPLEEKRSLFNRTFNVSTVNRLAPKQTNGLSMTVKYASDRKESSSETVSVYRDALSGDRTLARTEGRNAGLQRLTGILSYTDNAPKHYVREKLYADLGRESGQVAVTGDWARDQQADRKGWTLENEATLGTLLGGKVIQLTSFTQWSGVEENLFLGIPGQQVKASLFDQQLSFSNISRAYGPWRFSVHPEAEVTVYHRNNKLEGLPDDIPGMREGSARASLWQAGLAADVSFNRHPFVSNAAVTIRYAFSRIGDQAESRGIGDVRLSVKYVTGRWECRLLGEAGVQAPDIQGGGESMVLTGYQSLWKGTGMLCYTPFASFSIEYIYRAPVSGWNFRTQAGIRRSKGNASARDIYDGFILSYLTDDVYAVRSEYARAELSKGLFSINGKAQVGVDYQHSASVFQQDGRGVGYGSGTLSANGVVSMTLFRRWGLVADVRVNRYRFDTGNGVADTDYSLFSRLGNTLSFSDAWSGSVKVDIHYDANLDKAFFFPDIGLTWKGKKGLRVRLEALNLLDQREYAYVLLSPLLEESYRLKIRPLTVLVAVDWQF